MNKKIQQRINKEMRILADNPFITLKELAKEMKIPKSTVFDDLQKIKDRYMMKGIWRLKINR